MLEHEDKVEILDAISLLADQMQEMQVDIGGLKSDVGSLKSDVGSLKSDVGSLKSDVATIKATMVTKDYLDDKLAEHGSRYGELIRQTNGKIELLTDSLVKEKSLSSASAKKVISAEPFGRR